MKHDKLYQRAEELSCSYIVTGHYARIEKDESSGRYLLKKAKDEKKDQSYVLYFLSQEQLAHTLFPLGEYSSKEEVREIADKYGFINSDKTGFSGYLLCDQWRLWRFSGKVPGEALPQRRLCG